VLYHIAQESGRRKTEMFSRQDAKEPSMTENEIGKMVVDASIAVHRALWVEFKLATQETTQETTQERILKLLRQRSDITGGGNMKTYNIDCIKMKDDIQAKLEASRKGQSNRQVATDIQRRLTTSNDAMAKLWRKLACGKVYESTAAHAVR